MTDQAKAAKLHMQRMNDNDKAAQFRDAQQAVINALRYEPNGLTIAKLQSKAQLSHRTLNDVLNHTNQVHFKDGLYFLAI